MITKESAEILFHELRDSLGKVIVNRFHQTYEDHKVDYDPDTCYEAADDILVIILAAIIPLFKDKNK